MHAPKPLAGFDVAVAVGAPLLLAVLEIFHPHVHDWMMLDLRTWLIVHYAQIPLFMLAALAVAILIRGQQGIFATLARVAMFVFAASYIPFDTAAGIVTGVLAQAARASGTPDAWRAAIDAVWTHPIVGGAPGMAPPPFLAVLGTIAWSVGTVTAAISLKRAGQSWGPCVLLAISGFGLILFKTHAWPGGPVTFGGLAIAAAWILYERRNRAC